MHLTPPAVNVSKYLPSVAINNMRPLQNAPFCPISASGSNFNPRNTQCIPACPVGPADRTGVVKIIAFLELEQKYAFFKGLNIYGNMPSRTIWNVGIMKYLIPVKRNFTLFELNGPCFGGAAAAFDDAVFLVPSVPETFYS